jgi:hypothetical protein
MARTLYFELHIRPLMREIDRQHMIGIAPTLDLWSYDSLAAPDPDSGILWRERVRDAVADSDPLSYMPPSTSGGPWPEEWLALYKRWLDEGAKRLPFATMTSAIVTKAGNAFRLRVTGSKTGANYAVWLDTQPGRATPPVYELYEQPPEPNAPAPGVSFDVSEFFDSGGAKTVRLIDRSGAHDIMIPP